ncbi:MAG: efflux RND transporter permease subunit [Muribaculaceae bacterium]|nr:efflux RND transporter permease subunit [Muribaculaceae bacterium]
MLNRIIKGALGSRVVVLILSALVLVSGVIVLLDTEVDIFPDLNAPTVVVMTESGGYTPDEVEKLVTYPIETAVNGATGVRRVRSSSTTGFSVVWVEFDWDTDVYRARQIVGEKISEVTGQLPPGVGTPTIGPQSSILGEILFVGLTPGDTTSQGELRSIADRMIRPRLLSIPGVSQVSVIGGDLLEYQIKLDSQKMKYYEVSLDDVVEATGGMNANVGGGVLYEYGNEYLIKGDISTRNIDEIGLCAVKTTADGVAVTLNDIATVTVGAKTPRLGTATVKGRPSVLLTVTKQPGVGSIGLTDRILDEIAHIKTGLPDDVTVSTDIFKQSDFIERSVSNLQSSLIEGTLMVILVLFFFLMNVRTTVISIVALPLSVIVTVLVLHFLGFTINTMTLGGIAIAIGSLVDDAIVDVENVYKRLRHNRSLPYEQRRGVIEIVYEASREVRMPIFNSSLIIITSFIPLFFLSGIEGRMLIPLGIAFIVSLIGSTIVALTVTPVLCSYLLAGEKATTEMERESWLSRQLRSVYEKGLIRALANPRPWLLTIGLLFILSLCLFFTLGHSFLPSFNEGSFTVNVSAMPGISLEESNRIGLEAERIILETPEVITCARKTGRAELDEHSLGVNVSEIEVPYRLNNGRSRNEVVRDLRERLSIIPGVNIEIGQPISHRIDAMLSGSEAQIAVKLFGNDLDRLYHLGNLIKQEMSEVEGVVDVNIEQLINRPQINIKPRRQMLARYGITMPQFAQFIRVAVGGEVVSQVYENGLPYDLTLKVEDSNRNTRARLADVMIDTNSGKIPLSYVADITVSSGPGTINRENVARRIVISANTDGRDLRSAVDEIITRVNDNVNLPDGYYVTYGGQFESEARASRTLALASIGALLIIFMLLYGEFRNATQSVIILINMPLAMIGGILILVITGGELNIPAIIGFISLIGIATRNGMLLMSRYNHIAEDKNLSLNERVVKGSLDRLNPIIMTALTSALALIPLALRSSNPGNEIQAPMAIVILGGLLSSTALNIFIVPIVYYMINRKKQ